jgi:hypothetical protein
MVLWLTLAVAFTHSKGPEEQRLVHHLRRLMWQYVKFKIALAYLYYNSKRESQSSSSSGLFYKWNALKRWNLLQSWLKFLDALHRLRLKRIPITFRSSVWLSSGRTGKGEKLKHLVSNQTTNLTWNKRGLSHEQSGLLHPIAQQW